MVWNPKFECMAVEERRELQLSRLKESLNWVWERVPATKKKWQEYGVRPEHLKTLDDLAKFPFTSKFDLRDNYPFGLFAVPMDEVVRVHSSSGTTGKPVVVGYTAEDIAVWSETVARTIGCAGGTRKDVLQVSYGYGLFTGGLGLHYGGEKVGCTVIPTSGGNTERQIMIMQDFGTTLLACTPSYALFMADVAEDMEVDFKKLKLRAGMFGAEPWTDAMRREIEARLHAMALDIYGLSEVMGPGVSSECEAKCGLHIFDDHYYPEIVDPDTGEVLPYGEAGELVFTSLTKKAFPVVRFRTRDISRLTPDECECGRTHVRMERVSGRSDDMLIIRGVNVFPSQIESVLLGIEGTQPHYLLVVDRKAHMDVLEVQVEVEQRFFSDEVRKLEEFRRKIQEKIEGTLGVSATVKLVEPKTIERSMGKAKRVIDNRPK